MSSLFDTVDRFYDALGDRHWIFTDNLPVDDIRVLLDSSSSPAEAESRFVALLADRVTGRYWQMGLVGHEALRARRRQLERAREHYVNEQWDSCALVLVTVMDGFVNDLEPAHRRGLHARDPDEMVAWDRVAGHHKGLSSVMHVFLKPCKKRNDDEVFEVHRHGIVHGTLTNYSNQVVATKAWNMLAALADWAAATEKAALPPAPRPSVKKTLEALVEHAKATRDRDTFRPRSITKGDPEFATDDLVRRAAGFFGAWKKRQWALVADFLPTIAISNCSTPGKRALLAKEAYEGTPLREYELTKVAFDMAGAADVFGTATMGEKTGPIKTRWIYEADDGNVATRRTENAKWVLGIFPPHTFIRDAEEPEER